MEVATLTKNLQICNKKARKIETKKSMEGGLKVR